MFIFHLNLCILLLAQQYFPSNCSFPACGTGFCFLDLILVSLPLFIRSLKWQPTPVLLPGKFHGLRSLIGCSPWGHKESDRSSLSLSQLPGSSVHGIFQARVLEWGAIVFSEPCVVGYCTGQCRLRRRRKVQVVTWSLCTLRSSPPHSQLLLTKRRFQETLF